MYKRTTNDGRVLKDDRFQREQDELRKREIQNFLEFKSDLSRFREEEKKFRVHQKMRQLEEYEALQLRLDESRKLVNEPREAFRQIFLDAERKRLDELAKQEALLATTQQKPDPKDKKKGSAGGKKGKK